MDSNGNTQKIIPCRTGDDVLFDVPFDIISQAGTFHQMYRDLQLDAEDADSFEFPMPAINGDIFKECQKQGCV
ncbi:hypothetical protein DdX_12853 [Ditylenchus destructor]|uniref:Uncharacterized protein n=1 Tax=Ditylenchus destructor TaxID=166010 RepID=A0AAD4MW81_9BILA|nr:hypothetical protein DdX_12853 [Ditylenchus destructor]